MNTGRKTQLYRKFSPEHMRFKHKNRSSLSCYCSDCGKRSKFQQMNLGKLTTRQARKRQVLWRFKAVVNCVLFIMYYRTATIIKFRKKVRMLKIIRQTQGGFSQSHKSLVITQSSSPKFESPRRFLSKKVILSIHDDSPRRKYSFIKEESLTSVVLKKPLPKTVQTYITTKFIPAECKQQIHLQSLGYLNKKYQKNKNLDVGTISSIQVSPKNKSSQVRFPTFTHHCCKSPQSEYAAKSFAKQFQFFKVKPRLRKV